ncbi:MAG: hypothetical protein ACYDCK_09460, partial [Thermoplasmatota archaeon]
MVCALAIAPLLLAASPEPYSHRYLVLGRVVDGAGRPVNGTLVRAGTSGFYPTGKCDANATTGLTDAFGDFAYCLEAGAVPAGSSVSVNVLGATVSRAADADLRESTFFLTTRGANGTAPANFSASYEVDGMVWRATRDGDLGGVPVHGIALAGVIVFVNATVNGKIIALTATSDAFGEFRVSFASDARIAGGSVATSALGTTDRQSLDATFHRTRADLKLPSDGRDAGLDSTSAAPVSVA